MNDSNDATGLEGLNEEQKTAVAPQRELRDITADIWAIRRNVQRQALEGAIEVGRLLVEAKAMVPYGEWGAYIKEELDYSQSTANNLMKIFEEYGQSQQSLFGAGANSQALGNLTYTKALALLALPADEREEFVVAHNVEDMSARELQKAIQERDEAKAALENEQTIAADLRRLVELAENAKTEAEDRVQEAQQAAEDAAQAMDAARKELEELKARPLPIEKPDPAEVDRLAEEKVAAAKKAHEEKEAKLKKKLADAEVAAKEAEEALKKAQANAADLKAQAQAAAQAEVDDLKKRLAVAAPEVAQFAVHFDAVQREYNDMLAAVETLRAQGNDKADSLTAAVKAFLAQALERLEGEGEG